MGTGTQKKLNEGKESFVLTFPYIKTETNND